MLKAIYICLCIGLCIICGLLVAIAVDIAKIAKVVEKYGKDGGKDVLH